MDERGHHHGQVDALEQQLGTAIVEAVGGSAVLAAAFEGDRTVAHGMQLGLTRQQVVDVVGVWSRWYAGRGEPLSWEAVRDRLTLRAAGAEWRPSRG